MPARAEVQFRRYDGRLPVFGIDHGDAVFFRMDLATTHSLLEPAQTGSRTAANFWAGPWVSVTGSATEFTIPAIAWDALDRSGGRVYFRVSTRDAQGALLRSVQFGQSDQAPWIATAAPTISALDPVRGPLAGGTVVRITGSRFKPSRREIGTAAATTYK